jgi:hypothetical protein
MMKFGTMGRRKKKKLSVHRTKYDVTHNQSDDGTRKVNNGMPAQFEKKNLCGGSSA